MAKKIDHCDVKQMLVEKGVDFRTDFYALRRSDVDKILDAARLTKYRKSKTAPGSRARMYYQLLQRKRCWWMK